METLEGLNALIYKRLVEKKGNIKLTENVDIILYAKAVSISESQLVFKILEIEETIDWAELEKKKQQEENSKEAIINSTSTIKTNSNPNIVICKNCDAENEKEVANFCVECGSELKQEPEQVHQPPPPYEQDMAQEDNKFNEPDSEFEIKSKMPIIIGIISFLALLVLGYLFWGKDYLRDKNATRMYSFARSLALRSSPAGGGDYNMIGNISYGSEVLVYDNGIDWVNCKVNDQEGFASPKYLLNKMDFQELNAILADEDTRTAVTQTRFKKALLSYFRDNSIIGKMDESIQKELYGTASTKEVWQLFAKAEINVPNTVYFSRQSSQNSKFNDFACIIANNRTGERKILIFSFDDNENPKFEVEDSAPTEGSISDIIYGYDGITPTYTAW